MIPLRLPHPATVPLVCFHGSPGVPEDFAALAEHLPGSTLRCPPRGTLSPTATPIPENALLLGYSWGSLVCLREAAGQPQRVRGIVLISPYLLPKRRPGPRCCRLVAAGAGTAALALVGRRIVRSLLTRTSHPQAVPPCYQQLADRLADPQVLRQALLEKVAPGLTPDQALQLLAGARVPLALVWGAADYTMDPAAQLSPVYRCHPPVLERRLPEAGHGLLWTHPREVAETIASFLHHLAEPEMI